MHVSLYFSVLVSRAQIFKKGSTSYFQARSCGPDVKLMSLRVGWDVCVGMQLSHANLLNMMVVQGRKISAVTQQIGVL